MNGIHYVEIGFDDHTHSGTQLCMTNVVSDFDSSSVVTSGVMSQTVDVIKGADGIVGLEFTDTSNNRLGASSTCEKVS